MANRASRGLAAIFAAALAATPAFAHDTEIGDLMLENPHSRATPSTARTGVGYLTIRNNGAEADRLVAVACDCAEASEIHTMTMENNVMRMRELPDGLEIPAGGMIELKPGGLHLMFIGLKAPFAEGETVEASLTFEKAGSADVIFAIGPLGGMGKGHGMKGHGSGHGQQGHGTMSK